MDARHAWVLPISFVLVASLLAGCAAPQAPVASTDVPSSTPGPSDTPTQDLPATQAAASAAARAILDATSTHRAGVESSRVAAITQLARDRLATSTHQAGLQLTSTALIYAQATVHAEEVAAEIDGLYQAGIIDTAEGDYYHLEDFDQSWAQLNYYQWWPTGHAAENFVMAGDAFVSSASDNANWFDSACGISFALQDNENHDVVWIAMDGRAYLMSVHKNVRRLLEIDKWGQATKTNFEVHYMLVVNDKRVILYIDDQEVLSIYDGLIGPGMIANTLVSGTNKNYGTRCKLSNIDLWIIQ